jgi:hypothetical protein
VCSILTHPEFQIPDVVNKQILAAAQRPNMVEDQAMDVAFIDHG